MIVMPDKEKPEKEKPPLLSLERVRYYAGVLKELGESFQALMGKKPLRTKVAILANPENPQSMSILTRAQARFVAMAYYVNGVEEWGGLFQGLEDYAHQVLVTSPSIAGLGREQVIRLVGALSESKLLQQLGVTVPSKEKGKE